MPASLHYGLVADRPNSTRPQPRLPWTPSPRARHPLHELVLAAF